MIKQMCVWDEESQLFGLILHFTKRWLEIFPSNFALKVINKTSVLGYFFYFLNWYNMFYFKKSGQWI